MQKKKTKTTKKVALDKDLIQNEKMAKELLEKDGNLVPMLMIFTKNENKEGKKMNFICPLANLSTENKVKGFYELGKEINSKKLLIKKIIFLSESWCLKQKKDVKDALDIEEYYKTHNSLEEHPDRTEAITLALWETGKNKKQLIMQQFDKTKEGKIKYGVREELINDKKTKDTRFYLLEEFFKGYLVVNDLLD